LHLSTLCISLLNTKQIIMKIYLLKNGTEVLRAFEDYDTAVLKKATSNDNLTIQTVDYSDSVMDVEFSGGSVNLLDDDFNEELEIKIKKNTTTGDELEYLDIVSITLHGQNVFDLGFTPNTVRQITTESEKYADDLWSKRFDK